MLNQIISKLNVCKNPYTVTAFFMVLPPPGSGVPTVHNFMVFDLKVGGLKLAVVGVFTPWKSTNVMMHFF